MQVRSVNMRMILLEPIRHSSDMHMSLNNPMTSPVTTIRRNTYA